MHVAPTDTMLLNVRYPSLQPHTAMRVSIRGTAARITRVRNGRRIYDSDKPQDAAIEFVLMPEARCAP